MGFYNQTPLQTVFALIASENPALTNTTLNQFTIDKITVVTGDSSTARIRGKQGLGFTGMQTVTYNRINISTLFVGTVVSLTQFTATKLSDLLPAFNQKYGLNITAADLASDPSISSGATAGTLTINLTGSAQYYGTVNLAWTRGSKQLVDYYQSRSLTAITVPDAMLLAFKTDFTANKSVITAHNVATVFTSGSSTALAIVNMLSTVLGLPFTLGASTAPGSGLYDLSGFTLTRNTIDAVADANPDYLSVAVLTPPAVYGNQFTQIYLHYDYRNGTS